MQDRTGGSGRVERFEPFMSPKSVIFFNETGKNRGIAILCNGSCLFLRTDRCLPKVKGFLNKEAMKGVTA
jgi:hypothetical protein